MNKHNKENSVGLIPSWMKRTIEHGSSNYIEEMPIKEPLEISGEEEILVCACMQSGHWPFCDASHHSVGGSAGPRLVQLDKDKTYHLCQCYKTKNPPFCDGSHKAAI